MNTEEEIEKFEKARLKSKKAIPIEAGSFVVVALGLWIVSKFAFVPVWVMVLAIGLTAFPLLGDTINYIYCGRKLRTLQ
ncbi:MAG: hypothetical protein ABSG97_04345 [Sedimentisphaerales bacterium]|jgi:hypothetical protein